MTVGGENTGQEVFLQYQLISVKNRGRNIKF